MRNRKQTHTLRYIVLSVQGHWLQQGERVVEHWGLRAVTRVFSCPVCERDDVAIPAQGVCLEIDFQ